MSVIPDRAAPPDSPPGAPARPDPRDRAQQIPATDNTTSDAAVRITEVSKTFGRGPSAVVALDGISLSAAPGEFVCLIGASGCGKSTLLSLVAGLDRPTSGGISTNGRRVALMFQEPALFPWLTASRNVELALRATGVSRAQRRERAAELLELVHLGGFGGRRPHELSGGMRQRVALARALGQEADVLLMDEPFGALDAMTRDLLHEVLEGIWRRRGLSVLFVTHEVREAVRLGDRVVLLSSRPGRVIGDFKVGLDRPRGMDSADTVKLAMTIKDQLREEVVRHGI
jgi:NitT/TauT family transport system ATP-binding protein